jgi:4-methyl-5(b-hydroxyethyl)-thiazole monophosphate biosynthesis
MKKKALVILADGFEDIEAVTAVDILRRAGVDVTIAGLEDVQVKGARGVIVLADIRLDEARDDFDALVLPGGMPGAANLAASESVLALIRKMDRDKKIIAAICAAPALVLGPAGVLAGRGATCYPGMEENFPKEVKQSQEAVVVDANIITSQGPATALEFALKIAERLAGKDIADSVRKATLAD